MAKKRKLKLLRGNPFVLFDGKYICNGHWLISSKHFEITDKSIQTLIDVGQPFKKEGSLLSHGSECLKKTRPLTEGIPDWNNKKYGYGLARSLPLSIEDSDTDREYKVIVKSNSVCCIVNKGYMPALTITNTVLMASSEKMPVVSLKDGDFVSLLMPCDLKRTLKESVTCRQAIDIINAGLRKGMSLVNRKHKP